MFRLEVRTNRISGKPSGIARNAVESESSAPNDATDGTTHACSYCDLLQLSAGQAMLELSTVVYVKEVEES